MPLDPKFVENAANDFVKAADILPRQMFHLIRGPCIPNFYGATTICSKPGKIVYNAAFNDPDDLENKHSVQVKQINLFALAKSAKTKAELREVLLKQAMELCVLHYVKHPCLMQALFTERCGSNKAQYSIVTHNYITLRTFADAAYKSTILRGESSFVHKTDIMDRLYVIHILRHVLVALEWMHSRRMYHNAVSVDSVYIGNQAEIVLGDFKDVTVVPRKDASKEDYYQDVWGVGIMMAFLHHYEFMTKLEKQNREPSSWLFIGNATFQKIAELIRFFSEIEKRFYDKVLNMRNPANTKTLIEHRLIKESREQGAYVTKSIRTELIQWMEQWEIVPEPFVTSRTQTDCLFSTFKQVHSIPTSEYVVDDFRNPVNPDHLVNVHIGLYKEDTIVEPYEEMYFHYAFSFKPSHEHQILSGIMRLAKIDDVARAQNVPEDTFVMKAADILTLRMIIEKGVKELFDTGVDPMYRNPMSDKRFMVVNISSNRREYSPYPDDTSFLNQTLNEEQLQ